MSAPPFIKRRKKPVVERWLLIDTVEVLSDCWGWSAEEVGRAWRNILEAVARGAEPDGADELTRILWGGMRLKQRTGRATLPPALRAAVFERDGFVCRYCGSSEGPFELDHVHPVSRGGEDVAENLAVACEACNRGKGAKTLAEWRGSAR